MGFPGALPAINRTAIEKTILAGLAVGCEINDVAIFERKNYFYPDLPNGYQTSQLVKPICVGGSITLKNGKRIRLNRIHLEEDAGKLMHDDVEGVSLVDYNRTGTPLDEIVTEPDFSSAAEAVEFLEELRSRLVFSGAANCKMEEGGMRVDVNISLKPAGQKELGDRCEIKNLNSFKMVARAIEYEAKRQAEILDDGGRIEVQTRKWNDASGKTTAMRSKEDAVDYRYFPDPDQYAIRITREDVARVKKVMPVLAHQWREKFVREYGLPAYDANVLTRELCVLTFYIESLELMNEPKKISNWLMTDILAKATGSIELTPRQFIDIVKMEGSRKISRQNAKVLIDDLWKKPSVSAEARAKELRIFGGIGEDEIKKIIDELFLANPNAVVDYATMPDKVMNFFMGQTMKRTGGMADSVVTKQIISKKFGGR
jgi:aspartyl-tRNA(Asn)/glutamyl-tRNA(Gln) amidotransferase subunit B